MREIKCRAWKKNSGWLLYGAHIADFGGITAKNWDRLEGAIWTQFTGLKDKNGKEIYEGDIVDYEKHNGYMLEGFVGDIRYVAPGYMIKLPTKYFDMSRVDELQKDLLDYLEVIGNIYENPELLKL